MEGKRSAGAQPEGASAPKLPKAVADALPVDLVKSIESSAEDPLAIKRFAHARRLTKERRFVELYWDAEGKGSLKVVEGDIPTTESAEEEATSIAEYNAMCMVAAPTSQWVAAEDVAAEAEKRATALKADGFEEMEDFVKVHALHIPCFTWIVSDSPPAEDAAVTSSRMGGSLASYGDDDEFKDDFESFNIAFQVDLASVPTRMQAITGKSGLLQVFVNDEEPDCTKVRIIPEEDFGKLVLKALNPETFDGPERNLPAMAITGWAEHADYPGSEYESSGETAKAEADVMDKCTSLRLSLDKFGGYMEHVQGRPCYLGDEACKSCGETHLFARAVFNMADSCMLRTTLGDAGTLQVEYCCNADPIEAEVDYACC